MPNTLSYSAGQLKIHVARSDVNSNPVQSLRFRPISAPPVYPKESLFSTSLVQRPQGESGEALASSQATPTPHHSRRSYLRPSDHHLHLTPPTIPRPGNEGRLATAEAERSAVKAWSGAWIYLRSDVMTTNGRRQFRVSGPWR